MFRALRVLRAFSFSSASLLALLGEECLVETDAVLEHSVYTVRSDGTTRDTVDLALSVLNLAVLYYTDNNVTSCTEGLLTDEGNLELVAVGNLGTETGSLTSV